MAYIYSCSDLCICISLEMYILKSPSNFSLSVGEENSDIPDIIHRKKREMAIEAFMGKCELLGKSKI